jgi:thiol:disulfide interchange protein DsbC
MKIFLLSIFLLVWTIVGSADELRLKVIIEEAYPELSVKNIKKTEFNDLYEVYIGGQIIYTDEDFKFLIVEGRVVDPNTKKDMTSERLDALMRINFESLPFEHAIINVKGNGKNKLAIFSDVDCPFCRKLETETLVKLNNVTIYTFLYPLAIHAKAEEKSRKIWCAKDRSVAWNNFMLKGNLPENKGSCEVPIVEISELGKKLGIVSTPTIVFYSGKRVEGAIPYDELIKYIN